MPAVCASIEAPAHCGVSSAALLILALDWCVAQAITLLAMYTAARLHAHPLERMWLLLLFFLGAAEMASGVSGL